MKAPSSSLLILLLILCGCSNEIAEDADKIIEKPVPILINAPRQIDVETKAVVDAFTSENISYIKIFGIENTGNCYLDGLSPLAGNGSSGLEFVTPITYPVNGNAVTLYGIYPSNIITRLETTEIAVSITGQDDLMYASKAAGSKTSPIPVTFTFDHKLAQIKFKLKNQTNDLVETGNVSIIATGPSSATLNLTNGVLNVLPETTSFELPTSLTFNQLAADTETEINGELLLFPDSNYSFSLKIGDKYYAVTFDGATATSWKESSIYTLTISINSLNNPLTSPI